MNKKLVNSFVLIDTQENQLNMDLKSTFMGCY